MKIYTASSWRNKYYENVVRRLKEEGFEVYDFRNAISTEGQQLAFDWNQVDPNWEKWSIDDFLDVRRNSELAANAFKSDLKGMREADVCMLILPCGKSSHLEAGYMRGLGKYLYIYMPELERRELTYNIDSAIYKDLDVLIKDLKWREKHDKQREPPVCQSCGYKATEVLPGYYECHIIWCDNHMKEIKEVFDC